MLVLRCVHCKSPLSTRKHPGERLSCPICTGRLTVPPPPPPQHREEQTPGKAGHSPAAFASALLSRWSSARLQPLARPLALLLFAGLVVGLAGLKGPEHAGARPVLPPAAGPASPGHSQAQPAADSEPPAHDSHGTALKFARNVEQASEEASRGGKLVFLLHVSGNFEDPGET